MTALSLSSATGEPSTDLAESHADVLEPTTGLMDIPLPEPCHEPSTDLTKSHADAEEPTTDLMDIPSPEPCNEPSTDLTESHKDVEEPSTDLVAPPELNTIPPPLPPPRLQTLNTFMPISILFGRNLRHFENFFYTLLRLFQHFIKTTVLY